MHKRSSYNAIVIVFLAVWFASFSMSYAVTSFQFAPPRDTSPEVQKTDTTTAKELQTISEWETKAINAVPLGVRTQIAKWDALRLQKAHEYSVAKNEWLAFFFAHGYVFYGTIFLVLLFIIRLLLLRLNLIA